MAKVQTKEELLEQYQRRAKELFAKFTEDYALEDISDEFKTLFYNFAIEAYARGYLEGSMYMKALAENSENPFK